MVNTYCYEYLKGAVQDLDVLVLHNAAHHRDEGLAVQTLHSCCLHLLAHAARPVLAPPRVMSRDVEGQEVALLQQASSSILYTRHPSLKTQDYMEKRSSSLQCSGAFKYISKLSILRLIFSMLILQIMTKWSKCIR